MARVSLQAMGMSLMIFGLNLLGSKMLNFLILAEYATLLLMHWLKKLSLVLVFRFG